MLRIIATCFFITFSAGLLTAQSHSPREFGMGGTSAASADYLNAGFSNPALLTTFSEEKDDDWGLVVPNFSLQVSDRNNLIDALDDFNATFDALSAGGGSAAELNDLADLLNSLDDKHFNLAGGGGVAIALPTKALSTALVINTAFEADGFLNIDPADAGTITGGGGGIGALNSEAVLLASFHAEVGLAMATEINFGNQAWSLGATPKMQSVEILDLVVNVSDSSDFEDRIDDGGRFSDDSFNLDLGAATMVNEHVRFGLSARNLLGGSYTGLTGNYTYELNPALTTGLAYINGPVTLAADIDLNSSTRFEENPSDDSQFVRLGAETSWEWAQLRAGYLIDLEDNYANMATAGIGFSPFGVMHLDLAGAVGDNSYGAAVSLSFTF
ncbi:MAG: conjugal transfer protein TraF [Planctomycetota bacterium]|nr:conjugal transfer protein TraF [Planctomycetota bacterium]